MSRFKIAGTDYVSEWGGNDANNGTIPTTPYLTLNGILVGLASRTVIVGTGIYKGNNYPNVSRTFKADGKVIMNFLGGESNASAAQVWEGFVLRNASLLRIGPAVTWRNNIYENINAFTSGSVITFENSIVKPRLDGLPVQLGWDIRMVSSIALTSINNTNGSNLYTGTYVSKNCIIFFIATFGFTSANFSNNCFNGIVSRNGINYELKKFEDGSVRTDADAGILDLVTIFAEVYTSGNFACIDPEFIDIDSRTVLPSSVLLKRTSSGTFIGSVRPAQIIRLNNPSFQFAYTNINTANPLAVSTSAGQPFGQIRLTGKISDTAVSFSTFSLRTILAFFKGAAGGTVENNNVPDAVRLLGLAAGSIDKPRRLTYQMRTSLSTTANQASADSVWENDGAGIAGTYLIMEDNTVPQHAPLGGVVYGNGDPRGIGATLSSFNFCSIDIIVTLDQERV